MVHHYRTDYLDKIRTDGRQLYIDVLMEIIIIIIIISNSHNNNNNNNIKARTQINRQQSYSHTQQCSMSF